MEIRKLYPQGREKALTLSYDDGIYQDIPLVEMLNRYDVKATFNLNSGLVHGVKWYCWNYRGAESKRMDLSQVGDLYQGHEVAVHTLSHPDLTKVDQKTLYRELYDDRMALEKMFSCRITGMALPFGAADEQVMDAVRNLGFSYCRSVIPTHSYDLPDRLPMLDPTCHHDDPQMMPLAEEFLKTDQPLALYYLWGHSYEFDGNHNWDRMENFLQKTSGRPEIWYATNGQIIAYLEAMKHLVIGEDFLLNPTQTDLWIRLGEQTRRVGAGQWQVL